MSILQHRAALMVSPAASGSFPVIESMAATEQTSDSTSWVVTMPSGIAAGDLLIAIIGSDSNTSVSSWATTASTAWVEMRDGFGGSVTAACAYKEADGGGTDDLTINIAHSQRGGVIVYRISGHADVGTQAPEARGQNSGTSTTPDPASHTPTGGAKDYLWITYAAMNGGDTITSYPTNYSDTGQALAPTGVGASISYGSRELNAASEDPGVFTFPNSENWMCGTIAIHPA